MMDIMEKCKLDVELANTRLKEAELKNALKMLKSEINALDVDSDQDAIKSKRHESYEVRDQISDAEEEIRKLLESIDLSTQDVDTEEEHIENIERENQLSVTANRSKTESPQAKTTRTKFHLQDDDDNKGSHSSTRTLVKPRKYKQGDDICTFFERFQQYVELSNLKDRNLDLYLLNLVEDDNMYKKLKKVCLTPLQKSNGALLTATLREALFPAAESRILRSTLSNLKQKTDETIESFAIRIGDTACKAYSESSLREEASLSTLLSGINEIQIRKKLMESDVESFEQATRLAIKLERISKAVVDTSTNSDPGDTEFDVLNVENRTPETQITSNSAGGIICQNCLKRNHTSDTCWRDLTCQTCFRKGHIARVCRSTGQNRGFPRGQNNATRGRFSQVTCFTCGNRGHYSFSCDLAGQRNTSSRPNRQSPRAVPPQNQRSQRQEYLNGLAAGQYPVHPSRSNQQE